MYLVIGKNIDNYKNKDDYIILENPCEIKYLKSNFDIILNDVIVNSCGIIEGTEIFLEEILITKEVNKIYTNVITDSLKKIAEIYNISILHNTWKN